MVVRRATIYYLFNFLCPPFNTDDLLNFDVKEILDQSFDEKNYVISNIRKLTSNLFDPKTFSFI